MAVTTGMLTLLRRVATPRVILAAAVGYVGIALLLSYAVDVHDALGLRTLMLQADMDHPGLWFHFFGTQKITEVLQWVVLATATALAGILAGRLHGSGRTRPGTFWGLITFALAFMLMEDAGNVRKILANYVIDVLPQYETVIMLAFTVLIFGALAAVAVYALQYVASVWDATACRPYIVIAYGLLAIGALSDVSANVGLYEAVGLFIHNTVAQGQLTIFPGHTLASQAGMFMDSVWEEALELIGYSSFLAAVIAYWNSVTADSEALEPAVSGRDLFDRAR